VAQLGLPRLIRIPAVPGMAPSVRTRKTMRSANTPIMPKFIIAATASITAAQNNPATHYSGPAPRT
jgi:hypothetical protein